MRRWLQRIGLICLALLVVLASLWSWSRLRGPTAVQRQALELLEARSPPEGRNAFAALWLLRYDVPEVEQESVAAEDMKRMSARPLLQADGVADDDPSGFRSSAHERYRDLKPSDEDEGLFCRPWEQDCLRKVRTDPQAYEALAARNARLFERLEALSDYDYYRNLLPQRLEAPFPELQYGKALLTRHALQFAQGKVDAALEDACRDLSVWRRLGADSDSLIMRMVGIAYSTGGMSLLAEMLAELPVEHPLPAACPAALAPPSAEELWLCEPMRGEFSYSAGVISVLQEAEDPTSSAAGNLLLPLAFDAQMTRAEMAPTFASFCTQEELLRVAADRPDIDPPGEADLLRLECVSNAVGCILANIAAPAYHDYRLRAQDQGARLKLMATLLWLREDVGGGRSLAERITERPDTYRSPTRDVEITEDGSALRIRQFSTARGEYWKVAL